jgi:sulfur-oxidizing protein SoxX
MLLATPALAQPAASTLVPYVVTGDSIAQPLAGSGGDPARGAALFAARQVSTCLLCHAAPSASQTAEGAIGPSLAGVGARLSPGQIRLRIVDAALVNPDTIMPAFYSTEGLHRVGRAWAGRPVLDAGQIEDLVAYLATLRAP